MVTLAAAAGTASPAATILAIATLVLIVGWNKLIPRVPGYIVALIGATAMVAIAG